MTFKVFHRCSNPPILLRPVDLAMLSAGVSLAISNVRTTYFTATMPGTLKVLGQKIVYFGIRKYHSMQEKFGDGILSLQ